MHRKKPILPYKGLTVVMSNPSRFDKLALLSANGGHLFNDHCLRPEFNTMQVDVRVKEDMSPLLPDTKCILLLGEAALHTWIPESRNNSLNEVRGSVYYYNGIPAIASYLPQDAADKRNLEAEHNPLASDFTANDDYDNEEENEDKAEDAYAVKKHGKTKRANYAFWLQRDVKRCKHILQHGVIQSSNQNPTYHTFPKPEEVVNVLSTTKDAYLYFDMETDREEQNLQCFSFSFDGRNIYNVPVLDYNYRYSFAGTSSILRALVIAIKNNTIVSHNGANFDFFVLGYKYRIPVYRCYDTMIAHHRCWPDIEKSLGHAVSHLTWEHFHKDEDSEGYYNQQQMTDRMKYCGKDVYTMYLVHQAIEAYAKTIPGLSHSISTAMDCIVPYLTATMQGLRYNQKKLQAIKDENDKLMMEYLRIITILIGKQGMEMVRSCVKAKAGAFPGSNKQCCEYFHKLLGYPVVNYSDKTREPSLGKKNLYKLALKHPDNPVIPFTLLYRQVQKEFGTLKFVPFRDDNNKIINYRHYIASQNGQPQLF